MRRSTSKVIRVELVENNEQEFSYERPAVTNLKLTFLILMTFGIVVGMYALTNAIEVMQGSVVDSYIASGGVIFGLFIVYVIFFGVRWYCGAGQREVLKREAVEKQIAREKAMQALQNME